LPPYVFEFSEDKGWLERMINVDKDGFKYEVSQNPTENVVNILQPGRRFSADRVAELRNGDTIEFSKD